MGTNYVTDSVRTVIGLESAPIEATHPVESSEVRRFHQAVVDEAPRYWDRDWTAHTRYGAPVAPPAFPVHAFRRAPGTPDPLTAEAGTDFGGFSRQLRPGLPPVDVPLGRLLNAGYEYEFFRYARVGERLFVRSRYKDIYQKDGKNGPMVFIVVEDIYTNDSNEPLLKSTNTIILR